MSLRAASALLHTTVCMLALACTGCSLVHPVGPDYRRPEPAAVTLDAASSGAFAPSAPPDKWWQLYQEPELDRYVSEALLENRDLRSAASRLAIAQSSLDQTLAQRWPTTDVSVSAERARGSLPGVPGLRVYNSVSTALSASYEIDLFGRIRRSIEASRADVDAQQFAFAATQIQVAANTASAYIGICNANAALAAAKRTIAIDEETLMVTRRLADGGAARRLDVTRAQAQLESDRAAVPPLESQRSAGLYALATLLGQPPEHYPREAALCAAPPVLEQPLPTGDGLALLRRRPDIAQAERLLAAATANIGVATANLYPQISLGVSVGSIASTLPDSLRASTRTWSIGPLLQWTFPNQEIGRAQLRQAGSTADLAMTTYQNTMLVALKETETALVSYARELDHRDLLHRARNDSQAAFEQSKRLYRQGVASFLDLLSAQKALALVDQQLVASSSAVATDQVAVFLALGGGWSDAARNAAEQAKRAEDTRRLHAVAAQSLPR
ncbi:efflux transporter outer membrane subunit [Burkholderia cenocepacia]|uniref:Efflux transporter outer membrane subunit n=1 Tax=Burkholderia cenocepacia TaxID=95486 RepID=A0ABD4UJ94_9BURK|nr:efflux transporter outer membrane subunit [Burkholderia cenocepacia]MCW3698184.1 efflux transporter outer membrane subunit [Burkholderia cenocepacia]MCW3706037.1 efflux transporter outer membrane subunit [Burkholderia cenocepacia]MCW3714278.1 efflux transporter outer membrane subunit [Burkholderia cenocepacia]MCW3722344.1 efflux transporter outer membrane subunit [Burkholderia cenocepacia]MCW3730518.1 efflux transporter outer membrane subunit [Burkholderia cenocepacia]